MVLKSKSLSNNNSPCETIKFPALFSWWQPSSGKQDEGSSIKGTSHFFFNTCSVALLLLPLEYIWSKCFDQLSQKVSRTIQSRELRDHCALSAEVMATVSWAQHSSCYTWRKLLSTEYKIRSGRIMKWNPGDMVKETACLVSQDLGFLYFGTEDYRKERRAAQPRASS